MQRRSRSDPQGACYLANTNVLLLGNDMQIGWENTFSNSLPIALYLGQTNYILTGCNGVGSDEVEMGYTGCTNALMTFRSGLTAPAAYFASPSGVNGGRIDNFWICNDSGGNAAGYAVCDFTGGNVAIMANTMQLGQSGAVRGAGSVDV